MPAPGTSSVEGGGAATNHRTHYWALRQQARYLFVPWWETGDRDCVVALLWWWGVVFDLWIVVASIERARFRAFLGRGFLCV